MRAVGIIPARFASTRFHGKPLACETGKPLIQHVYERLMLAERIERVLVATDDERVVRAVEGFGGAAVMTRPDHASGTDRVAEVAADIDCDVVVNVQGDEPEIEPGFIDRLVELLAASPTAAIATLACPFAATGGGDPSDPNAVKVVTDLRSQAVYFSRAMIPYHQAPGESRSGSETAPMLLHVGVYAFRRPVLLELAELPPTPLEMTERLEQLRWIEHGYRIAVAVVDRAVVGVDTPADYAAFVQRHGRLPMAAGQNGVQAV